MSSRPVDGADGATETDGATGQDGPDGPDETADARDADERPWYDDSTGRLLVVGYLLGTLAFVAVTVGDPGESSPRSYLLGTGFAVVVPLHVYVFAVLGGLGYVFTRLVRNFEEETVSLVRAGLTVVAALPLGAGVYLLSAVIVPEAATADSQQTRVLLAGIVFLSGLYVNLTYKRLGALAKRLLPRGRTADRRGSESDD